MICEKSEEHCCVLFKKKIPGYRLSQTSNIFREEGIESRHLLIYITLWRVIKYFGNPTRPPRLVPPPRIDLSAGRRSQQVFYREKTRVVDKVTRMLIGNFLNDVNPSYIEAVLTRLFSHTHR